MYVCRWSYKRDSHLKTGVRLWRRWWCHWQWLMTSSCVVLTWTWFWRGSRCLQRGSEARLHHRHHPQCIKAHYNDPCFMPISTYFLFASTFVSSVVTSSMWLMTWIQYWNCVTPHTFSTSIGWHCSSICHFKTVFVRWLLSANLSLTQSPI